MLKLSVLGKILGLAKPCTFDMCNVGSLCEPQSNKLIKKRMVVCTTSRTLRDHLDRKFCRGDHAHFQIAGSTKVGDQTLPVSKFTEKYTRKFARQVIRLITQGCQKPSWMIAAAEGDGRESSHKTKTTGPEAESDADHSAKPSSHLGSGTGGG